MQKKLESHTAHSQAAGKACKTYQLKLEGQLTKVIEEVIWPRMGENSNRSNNCPYQIHRQYGTQNCLNQQRTFSKIYQAAEFV